LDLLLEAEAAGAPLDDEELRDEVDNLMFAVLHQLNFNYYFI
jgi:hypothetical protein